MGKRKKNTKKRHETQPVYQRRFQEGDMIWLAEEYRRRSNSDPSLTLEDFAAQYAVPADKIRSRDPVLAVDEDHCIALWHGTTRSRAESILREGFKPKKAKKSRIYFARSPVLAKSYAKKRSKQERDHPAVISCSINLGHYSNYTVGELQGIVVFAFRTECIDSEVVRRVSGLGKRSEEHSEKPKKRKADNAEITNIALTFGSAIPSIVYWINSYLKLDGPDRIDEKHEAVGKVKQWFDDQMDAGRFGPVPDDEILEQVEEHLRYG